VEGLKMGNAGATHIAAALKINKTLIMLNLEGNKKIGSTALAQIEEALIS
jgi:predicted homoserine dehydrogenase-like protein